MKTQVYNTIQIVQLQGGGQMQIGSTFQEFICEKTGIKLEQENPVGIMKLVGTKRRLILPDGHIDETLSKLTFETIKKLINNPTASGWGMKNPPHEAKSESPQAARNITIKRFNNS